jgi:hypothetical protein
VPEIAWHACTAGRPRVAIGVKAERSTMKLSLAFAGVLFAASVNANKPHILLVVVDDLGW